MSTTTDDATIRPGAGAADPFDGCLRAVGAALADVVGVPAWMLAEDAVQLRLTQALQVRAQVEELTTRLLTSVDQREIPRVAGASSVRAWLMATRGVSVQDASRLVAETGLHSDDGQARAEETRIAWAAGRVTAEQAVLISKTVDRLGLGVPQATVNRLQTELVGHARTLSYVQLQQVCRHSVEVVDPDGADAALAAQLESEEERARRLCELKFRRSGDGWTGFAGRLPDAQADMWKKVLDSYTSPRHERAVAPIPSDTVNGVGGDDNVDRPSYPQRLGRAFCELIEHLPTSELPQHGANPATVMVTISLDQLRSGLGEALLDTGTPMSPGQCRRLACNSWLVPLVLGADSTILDLGLARRLFDRYQRLALAARDRGCVWPGCEHPPAWCEAHHIRPWSERGPTDLANGCLLCPFHHHLVHSSAGWQIRMAPDGVPEIVPPSRLDPDQQSRRHQRFQHRQC